MGYFRLKVLASRQVNEKTYIGLRLDVEPYKVTKVEEDAELASGRFHGSEYNRISALGISVVRDSRDHVFYPTSGVFGEFSVLPSSKAFGADSEFTRITLDTAHYFSPFKKLVMASYIFAKSNIGELVPFNQHALIEEANVMCGLYYDFFKDINAVTLQEELRWKVWRRLGMVGFGGVSFLGNENDILKVNEPKLTYGGGLRLETKNRLIIRLDYGKSPYATGNFYATKGEAF